MSCEETEQMVRIVVRDDGIGIAEEDQERIFERFFRSADSEARSRSTHGLGFPLAHDIVQLHYGALTVSSELNEGPEFVIQIWKEASMLKQTV